MKRDGLIDRGRALAAIMVLAALALFALGTLAPRVAFAQDRRIEAAAKEAMKRARADFAAADYDGGLARLLKASRACGTIRCSAPTRAALLRDTGAMQVRRGSGGKAAQLFTEALRVDKRVELAPPYDAPDVRAAWNAATEESGVDSALQPAGDFSHTPVPEQAENTPVPVYVEYGGSDVVSSVVAKYKGAGSADWKRVNLVKMGPGWGGLVPCADVKIGVLRYYLQGFDSGGSPNALSGDLKRPFHVAIRRTLVGQPPSLPGQPPPASCVPGQEGVALSPAEKPPQAGPTECIDDSQCNGAVCTDGRCAEPAEHHEESKTHYARFWIGLSLSMDLVILPGANDVCKLTDAALPLNGKGYYCTNPSDGSDFPTRASHGENNSLASAGSAGQVSGGPALGNVRILGSFDFAINPNVLLGARVGVVVHTYPGSAATTDGRGFGPPIQLELRGTYLFGQNPLARSGFSPMAFVDVGAGKFDAARDVSVTESAIPGQLPKTAWRTGGPGFAGLGGGVRSQFSQRVALNAALKLALAFGGNGIFPTFGPEIALQYGF